MRKLITAVPSLLVEVRRLARTFVKQAGDILANSGPARTPNGPTKAINGRIEHLHGSALRF